MGHLGEATKKDFRQKLKMSLCPMYRKENVLLGQVWDMLVKYCLSKARVCSASPARHSQPRGHHGPTINDSMLVLLVIQLCQKNQVLSKFYGAVKEEIPLQVNLF